MSHLRLQTILSLQIFSLLILSPLQAHPAHNSPYCGPEVLSRVYEKFETNYSLKKINRLAQRSHGLTTFYDLIKDAKSRGLKTLAFKFGQRATLEEAARQGSVVINNHGHFVLVEKAADDGVFIYDPGFGFEHYSFSWELFQKHWDGYGLIISRRPIRLDPQRFAFSPVIGAKELKKIYGANPCSNCSGASGCFGSCSGQERYSLPNGPPRNSAQSSSIRPSATTDDPVHLQIGNLHMAAEDLEIPARGLPLNLTRYYNAQTVSETIGWLPDAGAGTWAIEGGEYSGQGNRTTSDFLWQDFTLELDMKTITAGSQPWEAAWINFRYTDENNRYYFLIHTNGTLELAKFQGGVQSWLYNVPSGNTPFNQNHLKIVTSGNNIKAYVNSVLKINYTDANPILGQGRIGLEAYYSHAHFDNVSAVGESNNKFYDFNTDDNDYIFGYGWTHAYALRVNEYATHVTLIRENNSRQIYTPNGDGTYAPVPTNTYDDLFKDPSGFTLRTKFGIIYRFDLTGKLLYMEDRNGNGTTLGYSLMGGKERLTSVSSDGTRSITLQYGANNMVERTIDPAGGQILYSYNAAGQLTGVTDRNNFTTQYTYDPVTNNMTQLKDKENKTYTYTYAYNDRVLTQTDPLGNTTTFDYNWDTVHVSNQRGEQFKYNFDSRVFLQAIEDPNGLVERTQNDANGNIVDHWDRNNRNTHLTYDAKGNVISIRDAKLKTTSFTYHPDFNIPASVTNARGYTTSYTYDAKGNLTKITDALTNETNLTYDNFGQLTSLTDARGNATAFAYNAEGDLISKAEPNNRTTLYAYDDLGRLTQVTNALGGIITYAYNNEGQLLSLKDPLNQITAYSYSPNGNLLNVNDPKSNATAFTPDAFGNVLTVTDAQNGIVTQAYDAANQLHLGVSNVLSLRDQKSNPPTAFTYDKMNRLKTTTDAQGRQYLLTYDQQGNLITRRDAKSQTTNYAYDELNRLVTIDYSAGSDMNLTLDEVGNVTRTIDALGTTTLSYDALNRPTSVNYPGAGIISYSYDAVGNRSKMIYPSGTVIDYVYNANNELAEIKKDGTLLVQYTYDALGRRSQKIFPTYPYQQRTSYSYDMAHQLLTLTNFLYRPPGGGGGGGIGCFLKGTPITMADGTTKPIEEIKEGDEVLSFDEEAKTIVPSKVIKPLVHEKDTDQYLVINDKVKATVIHRFYVDGRWIPAHQLRLGDFLTKEDLSHEEVASLQHLKADKKLTVYNLEVAPHHNYFASGYLVHNRKAPPFSLFKKGIGSWLGEGVAEAQTLSSLYSQFTYSYDQAGNRLTMNAPNGMHYYTYNNIYELTGVSGAQSHNYAYDAAGNRTIADGTTYTTNNLNQYSQVGASVYSYDFNGNMTSDGTRTLTYDYENRLTAVSGGQSPVYAYDGFGRRIRKTVSGVVTKYVYDGDRIIEERNSSNQLLATFIYGPGIDEALTMTRGGETYYYFYDGLGSVTDITNASGAVVESYTYDPYGNPQSTSSIGNPYYFTGRQYDSETGLYYYRARHYNAAIGRFLQRDPLGHGPDVNVYRYVGNNPVNFIDPWGLEGQRNQSWWDEFQKYLIEVGAVMETKYTVNLQDFFGQVGFIGGGYANVGYIPKGIGYGNSNFLEGGRAFYRWANQYGSGYKVSTAVQLGQTGTRLTIIGVGLSAYSLGEMIDSYYYGYVQYKNKYGGR